MAWGPVRFCGLLLLLLPLASSAPTVMHRVIVRFIAREGEDSTSHLRDLRARSGVVQVKELPHLGMAIAFCESQEAEERLVLDLEADPHVDFATPDTPLFLEDTRVKQPLMEPAPLQDLRKCSAQSGCAALGLVGYCCPAQDGLMLACCDGPTTENLVAFKSFHGKYMVAEEDGHVRANRLELEAWEKFQIFYNGDGTVSLKSHFEKYVAADGETGVSARSPLIQTRERFELLHNGDLTVSFKTSEGKYLAAEENGELSADRTENQDWERFEMVLLGGPSQRIPNDANFSLLWGMHDPDDNDIDAPEAWKTFTGEFSAGIVVAVVDTGIDYNHEDLRENMWVNPGEIPGNGVDDDGNGFVDDVHGADFANGDGDPFDDHMHGTHCAGTIAGLGNNGVGVTGVAWHGVRLMALKFLDGSGDGKTADAVSAIDYAVAHGAKIASNSWGGGGSNAALRVAIERAAESGMLFVAAAGNAGTDNDEEPRFPANYAAENVVAVASTTREGALSGFSCYGASSVDVAAPGSHIFSTVPNQGYKFLSGTSMATPHVSGLAALVWMYRPALGMGQVRELLLSSVEPVEALQAKVLTGGRINAQKALEAASLLEPPYPPVHPPQRLLFKDSDPQVGTLSGTVTIFAAAVESDVEYYKVYFVSKAGFQLDAVGTVTANGSPILEVPLGPVTLPLPHFVAGLVAVSGNASGEMPAQLGGSAPNATLEDSGTPLSGPGAVAWEGDVDLRAGVVAGKLSIERASDESSISHYNVYWSDGQGTRGPLLGNVPAIGHRSPRCTGDCELLNVTASSLGQVFSRGAYSNNEGVTISASGPGVVRVLRFDTEEYYDTLKVAGVEELSGSYRDPFEVELPPGPVSIVWSSDGSITRSGWAFELVQTGSETEFDVPAMSLSAQGLEVVASYGSTELLPGVFAEVADFDGNMRPSPAFSPRSLHFQDQDPAKGVVAGTAELELAPGAGEAVTFYQLHFADAHAEPLAAAASQQVAAANLSVLHISIPPSSPPAGTMALMARAGNRFGLSERSAVVKLVDWFVPPNGTAAAGLSGFVVESPRSAHGARARCAHDSSARANMSCVEKPFGRRPTGAQPATEPWLQRHPAVGKRVFWPQNDDESEVKAAVSPRSHVLGSVTLPGLPAKAVTARLRTVLAQVVAAALPSRDAPSVELLRVSAMEHGFSVIDFSVEVAGAPLAALDRIEARLIILSRGGAMSQSFTAALIHALEQEGHTLPPSWHVDVSEPRQVRPRPSRAPPVRRLVGAELNHSKGEEAEATLLALLVAGGVAAAVLTRISVLAVAARQARGKASSRSEVTTALQSVHVQPHAPEAIEH